jgi:hypothetical protein
MPVEILRRFDYRMLDFTKREFKCTLNRLTVIMAIHVICTFTVIFIVIYVSSPIHSYRGYE